MLSPVLRGRSFGIVFESGFLAVRGSSPIVFGGTVGISGVREDKLVTGRGLDGIEVLRSPFAPPDLTASDLAIDSAFFRSSCWRFRISGGGTGACSGNLGRNTASVAPSRSIRSALTGIFCDGSMSRRDTLRISLRVSPAMTLAPGPTFTIVLLLPVT